MKRTLVAGFGNRYRRDDGAGPAVVNALLLQLGRPPLDTLDDGFDDLGHDVDVVVLHQLVPELAESLEGFDQVIFVDAHVSEMEALLREEHIQAAHKVPFVAHQTHPSTVLALAQGIYGQAPAGVLLSLRGHDFDFGEGLSPETEALVRPALARITELVWG